MTSQPSVLVIGVGELGNAVLEALAAHPQHGQTTVLLRPSTITSSDPTKKAQMAKLASLNISTLAGDIVNATEDELSTLFAPYHTVVGCTGMTFPAGSQLKIARAVLAARVRRYLPWQFGVDYDAIGRGSSQDLFSEQLDVRDLLRGQKETQWVIISTGMFMSFLFWPPFDVVSRDRRTVRALGDWDNKVTVTTPRDIGRVVAEVVWASPETQGVVFTAGETVSYRRVAEVVEKVCKEKVNRQVWSMNVLKEELAKNPEDGIKKYKVVFAEGRGVAWDEATTFNSQRGMKLQGLEDWGRENVRMIG
ncbi:hypothetical protein N7G274_009318 [Stereocaulon virgatum]|uniref:NmrA-like domain-containing protein n=1 Tax=Stereocaulon virgatum TaxID=373712 RepID=A0ABR3ZW51_9LECA